ncbi:MAG: precorrin-3B C(17)-methyltransferase [Actinomycetota bacterium]|nr:precorrin-3B C(17)-methyltransferase [Actinomycetota bacterium]
MSRAASMATPSGRAPTKVLSVSVTEAGRAAAARLPFEHVHGRAADTIRRRWGDVDGFVLFLAAGATVRIVGPLLADKRTDPALVCVDEASRYAVALCGGHAAGANELARRVAGLLGAEAVVTTATDATGTPGLDAIPGLAASGDVAGVTRAWLDGRAPLVGNELGWPLPAALAGGEGPERVVVTDRLQPTEAGTAVLHPRSLVLGVGASSGAPAAEVRALVETTLAEAGLSAASVAEVATLGHKSTEPGIVALGWPVRSFGADQLAAVRVPTPSSVVHAAVGTPSVAEAAALLAAGVEGELVVPKRRSAAATVAIARRRRPRGHLALVGLGPGASRHRTPAAAEAVRSADVVIGYGPYVDQCDDLLGPAQTVVRSPIGAEVVRAKEALAEATAGRRVALVCSGDAGVYAMASLTLELGGESLGAAVDVEVVPGVTAALAAAAVVGAPLGHDHVAISLSDLLTPWNVVERRLRSAAEADLVVVLYNPRSRARDWQLDRARAVLLERREAGTPVAVVTDAARPSQSVVLTTLDGLDARGVGMTSCVIVGASSTKMVGGRMVTPRGYLS